MKFALPPLPYAYDALVPYMSEATLRTHHGKHHKAYVEKLNGLIGGTRFADLDLVAVVRETAHAPEHADIFNNAGQVWNHTIFWRSMSPGGARQPREELAAAIAARFGNLAGFITKFEAAVAGVFGSGWVWLVHKEGRLEIVATKDAASPLVQRDFVLFAFDVWEHAYYLDHKNDRPAFVNVFLDHLIDWDFALARFRDFRNSNIGLEAT